MSCSYGFPGSNAQNPTLLTGLPRISDTLSDSVFNTPHTYSGRQIPNPMPASRELKLLSALGFAGALLFAVIYQHLMRLQPDAGPQNQGKGHPGLYMLSESPTNDMQLLPSNLEEVTVASQHLGPTASRLSQIIKTAARSHLTWASLSLESH
jgi:hypothetical protein